MGGPPRSVLVAALILAGGLAPATVPAAGAPAPDPAAVDPDGATGEWNQFAGNAARTFAADVEPVGGSPRVAWRGPVYLAEGSSPVAAEGTLYAISHRGDGTHFLNAISLADGKLIASHALAKAAPVNMAAARGMVITAEPAALRGWQLQGKGFTLRWTVKGRFDTAPAVRDGKVLAAAGGGPLVTYDPVTGKESGRDDLWTTCAPAVVDGMAAGVVTGELKGYEGDHAFLTVNGVDRHIAMFLRPGATPERFVVSRLAGAKFEGGGWFILTDRPFAAVGSEPMWAAVMLDRPKKLGGGLVSTQYQSTIRGGLAYGFAKDGTLIATGTDGKFLEIVGPGQLPPGAKPGPATRARSVATFGNWAVDLDTRRVLWCLKDLPLASSIPVADHLLVGITAEGDLVGLTDRPEGSEAGATAPGALGGAGATTGSGAGAGTGSTAGAKGTPAAAPVLPALPAPSGRDGLLLADGTEVEGFVEARPGGKFRVVPASGPSDEVPAADILLAQADGKVLLRGRESALLARWRRTLYPAARDVLAGIHGTLASSGLHEAAAAVLADLRAFGLPEERAAELARKAAAVKPHPLPAKRLADLSPDIAKARAPVAASLRAAFDWCNARGFPGVAACLLGDVARWSTQDRGIPALAASCLPPGFPFAVDSHAGSVWMEWAPEIVAADGAFLVPDHFLRTGIASGPWALTEPLIVLRSPNTVFRSRANDARIVGRCLLTAEGTVRALAALLGPEAVIPLRGDRDLMDIRLHANKADYHAEESESGYPMPWSAGYYSPMEGVSRFFVPGAESRDPLGRGLSQVLAHELTHHFLEQRWKDGRGRRSAGPGTPGYWCVEGFARFMEDQVVEMDRRGLRFDDRTVPSLDSTAQAAARGVLFRPSDLLDGTHEQFSRLGTTPILVVRLRNTLEEREVSALSLFYEQAGATVYFLMNERGEPGRKACLAYLADYYRGAAPRPGWKALGFASAEEFDAAFQEFLKGLR